MVADRFEERPRPFVLHRERGIEPVSAAPAEVSAADDFTDKSSQPIFGFLVVVALE